MSGLVFIDDDNNNVIDEWMNESSSFVKGDNEYDIGVPVTSKGGLGFVETNNGSKQKEAANKKAASKLANKKRLNASHDVDDEMHGQVEHIEESRTSFTGKGTKQANQLKRKKEEPKNEKNKSSVPLKVDNGKPVDLAKSNPPADASVAEPASSTTGTEKPEDRVNSRIRKRTKTRSKQKNIRRDNRAAENKPAHLHVGNKEYAGRPLTEQTKSLLGVK